MPFWGLGTLKRCVLSRDTTLFPVLVFNNTVLLDFQHCILLMLNNQVNF